MRALRAVHHVGRTVVSAGLLVAAVIGGGGAGAWLVLVRRVRLVVLARLAQVGLEEVLQQLLQCDHMLVLERTTLSAFLQFAKLLIYHLNGNISILIIQNWHLIDEGNQLNNGDTPDARILVRDQVQDCLVQVLVLQR